MSDDFVFDFRIGMLGARGVGKTSMVAAMCNEFDHVFPDPSLQLIPGEQTGVNLQNLLIELKRAAAGKLGEVYTPAVGVQPTDEPELHYLTLHHVPSDADLKVTLTDYPGAWLDEKAGEVGRMLAEATIILVAVDAPALMERPEHEHEAVNRPGSIAGVLQRALLNKVPEQRLVLFVPIRSERWLGERGGADLYRRFEDRYARPLRAIAAHKDRVSTVFCPIQTLGSVRFSHYAAGKPMFERVSDRYAPVDCDQPLRFSLAFLLAKLKRYAQAQQDEAKDMCDKRPAIEVARDWIFSWFGVPIQKQREFERWETRSKALLEVAGKYAAGCKMDSPFAVLQNRALLGL